jgi:hypothetical protein
MSVQDPSLFGRLVGAHHVESAVVLVLADWLHTYLAQVERVSGEEVGSIARPRSIRISGQVDTMPEDQTPAVIVRSPGLVEVPVHDGDGEYSAAFEIEVGTIVTAKGVKDNGSPRALRLARMYALAIRGVLVQQSDPDLILYHRDWQDEKFDLLDSIDDRTICVSRVVFRITVPQTVQFGQGPLEPEQAPAQPAPQWPIAQTAEVTVTKVPLDEDMS